MLNCCQFSKTSPQPFVDDLIKAVKWNFFQGARRVRVGLCVELSPFSDWQNLPTTKKSVGLRNKNPYTVSLRDVALSSEKFLNITCGLLLEPWFQFTECVNCPKNMLSISELLFFLFLNSELRYRSWMWTNEIGARLSGWISRAYSVVMPCKLI